MTLCPSKRKLVDYEDETTNIYIKASKKGSKGPVDHLNKSAMPMGNNKSQ